MFVPRPVAPDVIAAQLRVEACPRRGGEVGCHDRRGTAIEGELERNGQMLVVSIPVCIGAYLVV